VHKSVETEFSCKNKLHNGPDKTDMAWSWSLLQMRDSDSGPKPRGTPPATTHPG